MKLTVTWKDTKVVNGLSVGNVEIYAEDCETPEEKAMAQLIASNIGMTVTMVTNFSEKLFIPPSEGRAQFPQPTE